MARWLGIAVLLAFVASATPAVAAPQDRAVALEQYLQATEGHAVPAGWTGDVASCLIGTESDASIAATLRAVNTLRSFAGAAPVTFDPELNRKALAAALMMRAADRLDHYPGTDWPCYSAEGAEAAGKSNLYLGASGVEAMTGYVEDQGVPSLGHRRWLLNPRASVFGTGSTGTTNALWVVTPESETAAVPELLAWPPPGHVPWAWIAGGEWSAAISPAVPAGTAPPHVDLSAATVSVTIAGRNAQVGGVTDMGEGHGAGPMLKWAVDLTAEDLRADRRIAVVIDGITVDGQPHPVAYTVDAMLASPPEPVAFSGSRSGDDLTLNWPAAVEHGVPVSGYRIRVWEHEPFSGPLVADVITGAGARTHTLTHRAPESVLWAQVIPQSRAGAPRGIGAWGFSPPPPPPPPRPGGPGPGPGGQGPRFTVLPQLSFRAPLRPGRRVRVSVQAAGATRLKYQWLRNGRAIRKAKGATYKVKRRDAGRRLACRVVAVASDGTKVRATTPPVRVARR